MSDGLVLIVALSALVVWWKLNNPLPAVFMVTTIDLFGYIPTLRKSFEEPWSETVATWLLWCIGNSFALLALNEYNLLTLTYILAITAANLLLSAICLLRRPYVARP